MAIHKGSELNNIKETWDQNEKNRQDGSADPASTSGANIDPALQQTIQEEAAAYDQANKEDRVLDGERATVNDNRSDAGEDA